MSEPTHEQLIAALRRADAAGDTEAARAIARAIQSRSGGETQQQKHDRILAELQRNTPANFADPTAGMSANERFWAGMGSSVHDTLQGIGQLVGLVSQADVDRERALAAPLKNTRAGTIGNIAGQALQIAMPIPAGAAARGASLAGRVAGRAAPLVTSAVRAGVFGAAQPVATGETRAGNAAENAAWGAGGQLLASGAGRVVRGTAGYASRPVRDAYNAARAAGIPLHFSQLTNSKPVKTAASMLGYLPFSGAGAANARQQSSFMRALSRSFGENTDTLTDDVMSGARSRLGGEFEQIYRGTNIPVRDEPLRRMNAIVNEAAENLTDDEAKVVANQFDRIVRKAEDGAITGEQYQGLRTALSNATDGSNKGRYIKQIRNELDELAAAGLGGKLARRLAQTRRQWANMRTTEKALKQVGGAMGDVRPAALWPLIRNGSTPEMRELARIGQLLKDPIPDSGTAGRLFSMGLLGGGGAPFGGVGGTLGMIGGGATIGRALNSPAAANFYMNGAHPVIQGLSRPVLASMPYFAPPVANAITKP